MTVETVTTELAGPKPTMNAPPPTLLDGTASDHVDAAVPIVAPPDVMNATCIGVSPVGQKWITPWPLGLPNVVHAIVPPLDPSFEVCRRPVAPPMSSVFWTS